jgi:hypothetical protein
MSDAYSLIVLQRTSFYGEQLLAPRTNPKEEDHPFSAVRYCLFNVFEATNILEAVPPTASGGRGMK